MDHMRVVPNPFKGKAKGVKVYDGKRKTRPQKPVSQSKECNCALCRRGKEIARAVRGQFSRYGKI